MDMNDPELWAILKTTLTEPPRLHRRGYQCLATAYTLPVLQYVKGEDSRSIGHARFRATAVGLSARA